MTCFGINCDISSVLYLCDYCSTIWATFIWYRKGNIRLLLHIFLISSPGVKKKEQRARNKICAVAIQVLLGLMFEFCEGVVYSQCVRLFFKIQSHAFILEKDRVKEKNILRFVMILSSSMTSFQILRLCQENFVSIVVCREDNHQPRDLGQLLDIPGLNHWAFWWALQTDEKHHRKTVFVWQTSLILASV